MDTARPTGISVRVALALPALAALFAYANSLANPFSTWDDPLYITANPITQSRTWQGFLQVWDSSRAFSGAYVEYFPLRDTVYWALHALFGLNPVPFHAANILFHALASALVAYFVLRVVPRATNEVALWAGLLFAVHPIHVESVTWISGLKDPMFFSLMLAAFILYVAARQGQRMAWAASLLLLVLSLLVKSFAIALAPLLLLWELLLSRREPLRKIALRLAPFVLVTTVFVLRYMLIGRANGVVHQPEHGSYVMHLLLASWAFVRYAVNVVAPSQMLVVQIVEPLGSWTNPHGLFGAVVVIGWLLAIWLLRRRACTAAFLLAWHAVCLAPVLLVPFPALLADRYLYAPSVALCAGAALLLLRARPRMRWFLGSALVVVLTTTTMMRNVVWREETNLWREVLSTEVGRRSPSAWEKYGDALAKRGEMPAAIEAYQNAMRVWGNDGASGTLLLSLSMALVQSDRALEALPLARRTTALLPASAYAWEVLRATEAEVGNVALALAAADMAVSLDPSVTDFRWNRAAVRIAAGDVDGGIDDMRQVLQSDTTYCPALRLVKSNAPATSAALFVPLEAMCRAPR